MTPPLSHPPEDGREGVELIDHLEDVANRVSYVVPEDAETPSGEPLRDVVYALAWVHDIGKATTYFQRYLDGDRGDPEALLRHHAPLGSYCAYYALQSRGFDSETILAGFVAVAKHHGRLPNVAEYVYGRTHRPTGGSGGQPDPSDLRFQALDQQLEDITANYVDVVESVVRKATAGNGDWHDFRDRFDSIREDVESQVATSGRMPGIRDDALSDTCYSLQLQSWSALVLADKTSAAGAPKEAETYDASRPEFTKLETHVRNLESQVSASPDGDRTERLNHYRSTAREDVVDEARDFAEGGSGIATLTLPTGMGKTLSGLSAALSIRNAQDGDRVVYALPFTSIIDQVVDTASDIFETNTAGRTLTAHHHLADTKIWDAEPADSDMLDRDDDVAGILGESWRAGLTVTTFVQLFESLAGPANTQSMKLPALHNSVIILDEPQSLPLEWWKLVERLARLLVERYDATVIAMTATQPRIFESSVELVRDPDRYFEAVQRVTYTLDESTERYLDKQAGPKDYDEAARELQSTLDAGRSLLAVCNTIDSARELSGRLETECSQFVDVSAVYSDRLQALGDPEVVTASAVAAAVQQQEKPALLHLTTRHRPIDRLTLIDVAKQLTADGHPLALVSTQLVEAGVDVSFDRVYRDLAPTDSIVQAAGRCNRSFERDVGKVSIWWLDRPGDQRRTPAEAVYNRSNSLLPVTAKALAEVKSDEGELTETAVARDAVDLYYERLHEDKNVGKNQYVGWVNDAEAAKLGELSLVSNRKAADVLVSRTRADRELVASIRAARESGEYQQLRGLLESSKPLRVSVPYYHEDSDAAKALRDLPSIVADEGIKELDTASHGSYFDQRLGVELPDRTVEARIL